MFESGRLPTTVTMDEFGRILIPAYIRASLEWDSGDSLTPRALTYVQNGNFHAGALGFRKTFSMDTDMKIDDHGRIYIPEELRKIKEWELGERFELIVPDADGLLVLLPISVS